MNDMIFYKSNSLTECEDELLVIITAAYRKIITKENRVPHLVEIHDFLLEEFHDYGYSLVKYSGSLFPTSQILASIGEILDLEKIEYIDENLSKRNSSQQILIKNIY